MTAIRYSRYVLVNEDKGSVVWYDNKGAADKAQTATGGTLFDFDHDNRQTVEHAIHSARHRMGIE